MHLSNACGYIMEDPSMRDKYPHGMTPAEVLTEIRLKFGYDAFELCTVIDVADELTNLYGRPR